MLTATSRKLLSQYWRVFVTRGGEEGNVAITFALALIPLMYAVGAAVDYSRANSVKAAMQAAGDSTALMVSKNAASLTSAQLQTEASNYFNALFQRPDATGATVTATYTSTGGSKVVLNATANVHTDFMGLMGLSSR
jgi:Flp pilus assembly protein TadG